MQGSRSDAFLFRSILFLLSSKKRALEFEELGRVKGGVVDKHLEEDHDLSPGENSANLSWGGWHVRNF